jgi:hypothetical protein
VTEIIVSLRRGDVGLDIVAALAKEVKLPTVSDRPTSSVVRAISD